MLQVINTILHECLSEAVRGPADVARLVVNVLLQTLDGHGDHLVYRDSDSAGESQTNERPGGDQRQVE